MFFVVLSVPLTMISFGLRFEKNPPKEINAIFGYRTNMSMKNKETWMFAHQYIGKLWKVCGWLILPISTAVMFFALGRAIEDVSIISGVICVIQMVMMLCTMIPTEIALRKNFDKNGKKY